MTVHVGSSLCRRACQSQFVVTPPKSLFSSATCSGENWSGKDAASICKCQERWTPQSDTVSLSAILI